MKMISCGLLHNAWEPFVLPFMRVYTLSLDCALMSLLSGIQGCWEKMEQLSSMQCHVDIHISWHRSFSLLVGFPLPCLSRECFCPGRASLVNDCLRRLTHLVSDSIASCTASANMTPFTSSAACSLLHAQTNESWAENVFLDCSKTFL